MLIVATSGGPAYRGPDNVQLAPTTTLGSWKPIATQEKAVGLPRSHLLAAWRVVRRPSCLMTPGPYCRRSSPSRRSRFLVIPECLILPSGPTKRYL